MKKIGLATLLAVVLALIPFAGGGAQSSPSQVYAIHGIDVGGGPGGFPVTVCVDGAVLLGDFRTGDIEGPVALDAGSYAVDVYVGADQPCDGEPAIGEVFDVPSGADLSIIAYWEAGEGPALTALANDTACLPDGSARVTARHLADAGPVDVIADGGPLFEDLANGSQAGADVPAGTYDVGVELVSGGTVIPTTPVDLAAATNTIVHVIGGSDSTPSVLVQALAVDTCAEPDEPTSTTAPAVTPASPTPNPAPPAVAVSAQPQVTG
jgi:hypothetical protein